MHFEWAPANVPAVLVRHSAVRQQYGWVLSEPLLQQPPFHLTMENHVGQKMIKSPTEKELNFSLVMIMEYWWSGKHISTIVVQESQEKSL